MKNASMSAWHCSRLNRLRHRHVADVGGRDSGRSARSCSACSYGPMRSTARTARGPSRAPARLVTPRSIGTPMSATSSLPSGCGERIGAERQAEERRRIGERPLAPLGAREYLRGDGREFRSWMSPPLASEYFWRRASSFLYVPCDGCSGRCSDGYRVGAVLPAHTAESPARAQGDRQITRPGGSCAWQRAALIAARMPCSSAVGVGGQPGISTSTGMTLATRPQARVALAEDAAGAAAVAHGDDELRVRRRVVGALQRDCHVLRHRAGHQQQVGVARARDEPDAESLDVVVRIAERVDLELAAVARAGVDLADRQRARPSVRRIRFCNARGDGHARRRAKAAPRSRCRCFAIWRRM